jgi:hypothetical protein
MTASDIQAAERVWGLLTEEAREIAKTELAGRVRSTGWEATLRWLAAPGQRSTSKQSLAAKLCEVLGIPLAPAERGRRSNLELLADNRSALALAEAVHIYSRIPHTRH